MSAQLLICKFAVFTCVSFFFTNASRDSHCSQFVKTLSILMGFDFKCNLFTHEHFASDHTISSMLNWNLKVLGKPRYPEKNLSEQRREPTTNLMHIMVTMLYVKSVNTLNQNTLFVSSTVLLISENSNWISTQGSKS